MDQPDDDALFDGSEPSDIVPNTKQPLDTEAKQRLREAHGTTGHLWTFRTATDHDGQALSAGWIHEGSGTLVTAHLADDQEHDQHDDDDED